MSLKVLPKSILPEWIDRLCAQYRVYGPVKSQGQTIFTTIHSADELDLSYATTMLPPKKVFLPPREELFRFGGNGAGSEPTIEDQPAVILGLHTCDLHAIRMLDHAFSQGHPDVHYLSRRASTILVSLECLKPCTEHAFCKDMGTLTVPEDFDLHLTDLGEAYLLEIGSEKGQALIDGLAEVRDADETDHRRLNRLMSKKWSNFPFRVDFDVSELPHLLSLARRSEVWDELGERCLGCGSCTLVCPTCYCFDVVDEVDFTLNSGRRLRVWDSCQLDHFATVAGGHDFRAGRAARLRHRFLRKGKYLPAAHGMAGCVGCGRCAQACLVQITPVNVFNQLYRRHARAHRNQREEAPA